MGFGPRWRQDLGGQVCRNSECRGRLTKSLPGPSFLLHCPFLTGTRQEYKAQLSRLGMAMREAQTAAAARSLTFRLSCQGERHQPTLRSSRQTQTDIDTDTQTMLLPHLHSFPRSPSGGNLKSWLHSLFVYFESIQQGLCAPAVPSVPSCLTPSISSVTWPPIPGIPGSWASLPFSPPSRHSTLPSLPLSTLDPTSAPSLDPQHHLLSLRLSQVLTLPSLPLSTLNPPPPLSLPPTRPPLPLSTINPTPAHSSPSTPPLLLLSTLDRTSTPRRHSTLDPTSRA
eukprot:3644610-Rhodomonas_salina.1